MPEVAVVVVVALDELADSQWREGEVVEAGLPELIARSIPAELARTLGPGVQENETWTATK